MRKTFRIWLVGSILLTSTYAGAAVSPMSLSLLAPVQFPPEDFSIVGARVSVFWGRHRAVYGLDVGAIGNFTTQRFVGSAVAGGFNVTHGMTTIVGVQAAGGANINTNKLRVFGAQIAPVNSNKGEATIVGLQAGLLANYSPHTTLCGVQVGLYNKALNVYGVQIGLINIADNLHGLQIGLVNFHVRGMVSVSPFLNIGF